MSILSHTDSNNSIKFDNDIFDVPKEATWGQNYAI